MKQITNLQVLVDDSVTTHHLGEDGYLCEHEKQRSYEKLYWKHLPRLVRKGMQIGLNKEDAEDFAMSAFLKLWDSWDFLKPDSLGSWLCTVCLRDCFKFLKKRLKLESELAPHHDGESRMLETPASNLGPPDIIEESETAEQVRKALKKLPEKYRQVIVLCDFENHSYKEIAYIMNITVETVKIRIFRARKKLRDYFEKGE